MRIGIDTRLWSQTGIGRYIQKLVRNLAEIDKENQYVIFARKNEINYQSRQAGIAISNRVLPITNYQLRVIDIRWHSLKEQIFMPFLLWREHLDLVHFPYFSVPIFYPGKFVVTIHDLILDHFDTGQASTLPWIFYKIKRLGYKLIIWAALKQAVKIITVSETTKQEIVDHYKIDPKKIVVTYEAADNNTLDTQGAKEITPLRCKGYFLYVGNAYPHKNLRRLLEAIANVKSQTRLLDGQVSNVKSSWGNLKLVLVGSEDFFYKKLVEKVREMGLQDEVVFWGEADRSMLNLLYKNAIALVFPSLMEGFGLPGVEAMANNCLVLASDIPVFHEVLGEAAIYFNPNDAKDIAEKMEAAIIYHTTEYEKYEKLRKKGFAQVKKYSWEKLARQTLEVYRQDLK